MTQGNYSYRTNPLFLRDQFGRTGKYGIPTIPKANFSDEDFSNLRLIGFDKVKADNGEHSNRMVHFFLYDYKFERVWNEPGSDIEFLQSYRAILTPDFSMYTQMPDAMLLYNVFRNRWCGAYFVSQGLRVIPTVNWGTDSSFDFCFEGIEKGSAVAVSTYMVQAKDGREPQTDFFMAGYNEMIRRIEPEAIICYHEPFPEMRGNIIYVNYELSSWQHMNDDIEPEIKQAAYTVKERCDTDFSAYMIPASASGPMDLNDVYRIGYQYAEKGSGSAYGGNWKPKNKDAERFLGKPGEIKITYSGSGYKREMLIGSDGRAIVERHYSSNPNPKYHSNPHDEFVTWSENGTPSMGSSDTRINYWDGNVPDIHIHYKGWLSMKEFQIGDENKRTFLDIDWSKIDSSFHTIAEFQDCMRRGGEVQFIYNGKEYGVFSDVRSSSENDYRTCIWEMGNDASEAWYDKSDGLLNYMIDGKKLREIIKEVTVIDRSIF